MWLPSAITAIAITRIDPVIVRDDQAVIEAIEVARSWAAALVRPSRRNPFGQGGGGSS
jgi:hypothetical protein